MKTYIETKVREKYYSILYGAYRIRVRAIRAMVDEGEVRVWDDISGCFTGCHSLSPWQVRRIRKLAKQS